MSAKKLLADLGSRLSEASWAMKDIDLKKAPKPKGVETLFAVDVNPPMQRSPLRALAKNRIMESMTRIEKTNYIVRVWRKEESLRPCDNADIIRATAGIEERTDLIEAIEALPRVEAIEVLDRFGNGVILYPDWK